METHSKHSTMGMHGQHYRNLAVMAVLSFVAMYELMYAMVDRFSNMHNNLNQAYMAGLMTAAMVVFELLLMQSMYGSTKANALILVSSAVLLVGWFAAIRAQAGPMKAKWKAPGR